MGQLRQQPGQFGGFGQPGGFGQGQFPIDIQAIMQNIMQQLQQFAPQIAQSLPQPNLTASTDILFGPGAPQRPQPPQQAPQAAPSGFQDRSRQVLQNTFGGSRKGTGGGGGQPLVPRINQPTGPLNFAGQNPPLRFPGGGLQGGAPTNVMPIVQPPSLPRATAPTFGTVRPFDPARSAPQNFASQNPSPIVTPGGTPLSKIPTFGTVRPFNPA